MKKDELLDRTIDKSEELVDSGLSVAGRAVGRAIGFFRRRPRPGLSEPMMNDQQQGYNDRRLLKKHPGARTIPSRISTQERLEKEIIQLEVEIDHLYHLITEDAGSRQAHPAAAASLNELVARARTLRDQLYEKRRHLSRTRRIAAREQRLRLTEPPDKNEPSPPKRPQKTPEKASRKPLKQRIGRREKVGWPSVIEAAKKIPIRDSSQKLIFDKITQNLMDEDAEIRRIAANRLGEMNNLAALHLLTAALTDPSEKVQVSALNALSRMAHPQSRPLFLKLVVSPNHHLRLAALRGLANLNDSAAPSQLIEALEDEQAIIRKTAATLLGWREIKQGVRPLIQTLYDDDAAVRQAAATALGGLRDDQAAFGLMSSLADPELAVRQAACLSLQTIINKELDVDCDLLPEALSQQVHLLKEWWREARVKTRLRQTGEPCFAEDEPSTLPELMDNGSTTRRPPVKLVEPEPRTSDTSLPPTAVAAVIKTSVSEKNIAMVSEKTVAADGTKQPALALSPEDKELADHGTTPETGARLDRVLAAEELLSDQADTRTEESSLDETSTLTASMLLGGSATLTTETLLGEEDPPLAVTASEESFESLLDAPVGDIMESSEEEGGEESVDSEQNEFESLL